MATTFNVEKRCFTCKATKLLEEFGVDRKRKDGRQGTCRSCRTTKRHSSLVNICAVDLCDNHCSGEYCTTHMGRYYKYGSYLEDKPISKKGTGYVNNNGYKVLYKPEHPNAYPSGHLLEHTYILSNHLGRPLIAGENVHHKNGDRLDNRIDNLELWSTSQPPGQRIEDKITWAKELLALYEPQALADRIDLESQF